MIFRGYYKFYISIVKLSIGLRQGFRRKLKGIHLPWQPLPGLYALVFWYCSSSVISYETHLWEIQKQPGMARSGLPGSQAACNFIKKETLAQVFSCEFCEIFKNTFFTEHLRLTAFGNDLLLFWFILRGYILLILKYSQVNDLCPDRGYIYWRF